MCRRDGAWKETKVSELVVGDLIQLKGGDIIPADAKAGILISLPSTHLEAVMIPDNAQGSMNMALTLIWALYMSR